MSGIDHGRRSLLQAGCALPLLGPSTARDTVGLVGDYFTDPEFYLFTSSPETYIVFGVRVINLRANLLGASSALDEAALDKYQFIRDAFLQRRLRNVYDGKAPQEKHDQLEEDLEPPRSAAPAKTEAPEKK